MRVSYSAKERSLFRSPRLSFRPLDLWGPGRSVLPDSGHVPWGCCKPVRGSLPRTAEDSDLGTFCAEQRGPRTPGGAVPRGAGPGLWESWHCGTAASPRCAPGRRAGTLVFTSPPWLFFLPHLQPEALSPHPTRPTEDWGCGERGGLEPGSGADSGG